MLPGTRYSKLYSNDEGLGVDDVLCLIHSKVSANFSWY